jgi:hypothetical protein
MEADAIDWSAEGIIARREKYYAVRRRSSFRVASGSTSGTRKAASISTSWV